MLNSPNSAQRDNDLFKHCRGIRGLTYWWPVANFSEIIATANEVRNKRLQAYENYGLTPPPLFLKEAF
jgi:hypothetical protein